MAEIINLRRARKAKARHEAEETAASQRAMFGRTRHERDAQAQALKRSGDFLDQHRLDGDTPRPSDGHRSDPQDQP